MSAISIKIPNSLYLNSFEGYSYSIYVYFSWLKYVLFQTDFTYVTTNFEPEIISPID